MIGISFTLLHKSVRIFQQSKTQMHKKSCIYKKTKSNVADLASSSSCSQPMLRKRGTLVAGEGKELTVI